MANENRPPNRDVEDDEVGRGPDEEVTGRADDEAEVRGRSEPDHARRDRCAGRQGLRGRPLGAVAEACASA